ncbi:IclR family transcriptional regulator [Pseudonocardia sp. DLS-67]
MPAAAEPQVRSVGRAFGILDLLTRRPPVLPLREIVEETGLPKTTVVRLLADLQRRSVVVAVRDGEYSLGAAMLSWVRAAEGLWRVDEETHAIMARLVREHNETVCVYVRQDLNRIAIAQHEGRHTVRNVVEVGAPMPLWAGAASKVLLIARPQLVERLPVDEEGRVSLLREVAAAGVRGWARSDGEREVGAAAVAAPIRGRDGRVIAALNMSGPSSRFAGDVLAAGLDGLRAAAERLSERGIGSVEALL